MLEPYVTDVQLARIMGVSPRTVQRMRTAGMPSVNWGMTRCRRYLPSECLSWAQERGKINASPDGAPTPLRGTSTI